jgi:RNA polymerase sigma-70 factor, ECF subfamily
MPIAVPAPADERLVGAFTEHFRFVWRTLRRFGVPHARVDDAAAHVFDTLTRKLDQVEPGKERTFLLSTAVRVSANVRRKEQRAPRDHEQDVDGLAHPDPIPDELLEWKRRRELLEQVLDSLPDEQRTAFVLFELEGLSMSEISEALAVPMGTVASRLRRARARFDTAVRSLRAASEGDER